MPKLLFLSESCLFDHSSGAAISIRTTLKTLSAAGWEVRATTLNCCDGDSEYPLEKHNPSLDSTLNIGKVISVADGLLVHEIMLAQSTCLVKLKPLEWRNFKEMFNERLQAFRPDIVLTYCSTLCFPLLKGAQHIGAQIVFYVANPALLRKPNFQLSNVDKIVTPSRWLASLCTKVFKKPTYVLRDMIELDFDGQQNLLAERISSRNERFVTMINPSPPKGGLFFINLAAQAALVAPKIKFRAVESRWRKENWVELGAPSHFLDRIDWYPHTSDIVKVYEETSILLVPSLWEEASGRVIVEGLLSGLPVLAMRNGGITEQLGKGGQLFDLPKQLSKDYLAPPQKIDLQKWIEVIKNLHDNDVYYANAVKSALHESKRVSTERRMSEAVSCFENLLL